MSAADCIICAFPIDSVSRYPTLTVCGHNEAICSICFLRIRSLQRNFHCPSCKRELDNIIVSTDPSKRFADYPMWGESIGEGFAYDALAQMFFPKEYYRNSIEPLRQLKCVVCSTSRRDYKAFKGHLHAEHNLHLCMLCVDHKQVFPAEQKVYTKSDYDRHLRAGDGDGSIGHPNCEFCRTRFYDTSALFIHLNKEHYTCFLCEAQGVKFKYFHQYANLQEHFRKEHYICEEQVCMDKRFVAFANEIDLRHHLLCFHPHLTVNRTIPMQFKVRRLGDALEDIKPPAQSASYEGGLGGRAAEGMWQVELAPSSSDPRDPDRHADDPLPAQATEDFPALAGSGPGGGLVNNRWISNVKGSGGGSAKQRATSSGVMASAGGAQGSGSGPSRSEVVGRGKPRAGDFPSLPVRAPSAPGSSAKMTNTSNSTKSTTNSSSKKHIEKEYADLAATTPSAPSASNDFSDWVGNMRMDKRLQRRELWNSSGIVGPDDSYEADLTTALQESLSMVMHSNTYTQAQAQVQVKPANLDDQEAYPAMAAPVSVLSSGSSKGSAKSTSTGSAKTKAAAKPAASADWSNALKAVGMEVPKKKKKQGSGLTVVRASGSADAKLRPSAGSAK